MISSPSNTSHCLTNPPSSYSSKTKAARHAIDFLMRVTYFGQFLRQPCTQPTLALKQEAGCCSPASPGVSGLFAGAGNTSGERCEYIMNRREFPPQQNITFPFLEGEGRSLQVNPEPRSNPKLMQRSKVSCVSLPKPLGATRIRSAQRKRLSFQRSKFNRKKKEKPEFVFKELVARKAGGPRPFLPTLARNQKNRCTQPGTRCVAWGRTARCLRQPTSLPLSRFGVFFYLLVEIPLVCTA